MAACAVQFVGGVVVPCRVIYGPFGPTVIPLLFTFVPRGFASIGLASSLVSILAAERRCLPQALYQWRKGTHQGVGNQYVNSQSCVDTRAAPE
jgi:hypothetical protein